MASFKDQSDREWQLSFDAHSVQEVRGETCGIEGCRHRAKQYNKAGDPLKGNCEGIDLASDDGSDFGVLASDPALFVMVLWFLCREQAGKIPLTREQFIKGLTGDALEHAADALQKARLDFSPSRKRQLIQAEASLNAKIREQGTAKALAKINDPQLAERLLANMEADMDAKIRSMLSSNVTAAPAGSESAPAV